MPAASLHPAIMDMPDFGIGIRSRIKLVDNGEFFRVLIAGPPVPEFLGHSF